MIAGKTETEILGMTDRIRHLWYKTILPNEKEEAIKIVNIEMRAKISAAYTSERKIKRRASMTGENNPNFGGLSDETKSKMSISKIGKNNPMYGKIRPQISERMKGKNHPNYKGGISFLPYCYLFNGKKKEEVRNRWGRVCILTDLMRSTLGLESGFDNFEGHEIFSKEKLSVHHVRGDKMAGCNGNELALIPLQRSFNSKKFDGLKLEEHPFYITLFLLKDIERKNREEMWGSS